MDLIKRLQEIGLTGREAEIYITMLQKKEFKAPEIAKITTISRTKIYEVLQNLVNKGVCNERYEDGKKIYSVIEPDIAINNVLSIYQQELIRREKIASVLEKQLSLIHKNSSYKDDPLEYIEIVKDREQVAKKWKNNNKNAKKEILTFAKPPYSCTPDEAISEEKRLLNTNNHRIKMKNRCICEYKGIKSESEKKEFVKIVSGLISNNEKVRIIKKLPMKLAIFDERITMLALEDPISFTQSITTMIITHPVFAKALKNLFESTWEKGMTLEEYKRNWV
ncbi:MAG: helix-turn-helix domain-containing protein [Candidatus Cloacimonetes bacterium]|nr:helix-turn-helix domain-containing protein [Candidatus Cloacimonadota bacterium]